MVSLYRMHRVAKIASVSRCGVSNVWQNGLRRDKINTRKKSGYSKNVHVQCVGLRSVY